MSVLRRVEATIYLMLNDSDTPEYNFVQIIHADYWHLLALLFFDEEVTPVQGAAVVSTIVLVAIKIYQEIIKGLKRKRAYFAANVCSVIGLPQDQRTPS